MKEIPNRFCQRFLAKSSVRAYYPGLHKIQGIIRCQVSKCSEDLHNNMPCKVGGYQVLVKLARGQENWCLNIKGFDLVPVSDKRGHRRNRKRPTKGAGNETK